MRPIQDLIHRFQTLKDETLKRVEQAAKKGRVSEVMQFTRLAEECESALQQMGRLEGTAQRIEAHLRPRGEAMSESLAMINPESTPIRYPSLINAESNEEDLAYGSAEGPYTSKRGKGIEAREEWVAKVESTTNIRFRKEGTVTYRAGNQGRVGVAFASELNRLPNRWFLGLPEDDEYKIVVLLCRSLEGQLWDFVIPVASLEQDWWRLSRSGGQIKFNVRKDGTEYSLKVPKAGKHSIGNYLSKLDELEKLTNP